jgi:HK97 family phage major capsid protein
MSVELKETITALGTAFEQFKATNDQRLAEIEKGKPDPLVAEKLDKINADLTAMAAVKKQLENLEVAAGRGQFPGGGETVITKAKSDHAQGFNAWFRKGVEGGLKSLEIQANL